ncbi:MAG: FHA domain-containing protein, partial [Planctomycetales bacterium]|nr:FHA domain-containing protein [Planctomycetales bacterium]
MEFRLKILGGNKAGQEVVVKPGKFFIGRAEDCHLRPHSDLISRHHCVFTHAEDYTSVRDFGSKNGTYVNGERVETERELRAGDRLRIGPLDFEVVLEARVGGAKKPAVSDVREAVSRFAGRQDSSTDDVGDWLSGSGDDSENGEAPVGESLEDEPVSEKHGASSSETMAISNSETVIGGDELRSLLDAVSHLHDEDTAASDGISHGAKQSEAEQLAAEPDDQGANSAAETAPQEAADSEFAVAEAAPEAAPAKSDEEAIAGPAMGSQAAGAPWSQFGPAGAYPIPGISPGNDVASPYAGGYPPGAGGMPGAAGPFPGYPYPPQFSQQGMPYGYWPQPGMQGASPQPGMPPQGGAAYPPGVTPP